MTRLFCTIVLVMSASLSEASAQAPQRTMSIYKDWTLACAVPSAAGAQKSCGLVQVEKIQGQPTPVGQIGIGRSGKSGPFKLSIETHAHVWIPTGVRLTTDDNEYSISAGFKWCIVTHCLADAELTDAEITTLRGQRQPGRLIYRNGSQAEVSIPVSFSGFREAMDALQKE
jgi:invasion protein IalB